MKKRILNTVLGSLITGVGVSITINAHLGLDPLSGVYNVLANIGGTNLSVGILIVSFVMLLITFIKDRKLIGLGTIVNPLMVSLMIEFVPRFTLHNMLWIRILVLMVGFTIISAGTILYIKGDLGVAPYDAITILFADLINMSFGRA